MNTSYANNFNVEYKVSTKGIKIGYFDWSLKISDNVYETEIKLENSGIFSPLYKFKGNYLSVGIIENGVFKTQKYRQFWETKKKMKIVNMLFDDYLIELIQEPAEKEVARISLEELYLYFDPITSFINILNGKKEAKTVDGRRIYTMSAFVNKDLNQTSVELLDYLNLWADHKRTKFEKIAFEKKVGGFLPSKILIYFDKRIFKLEEF